MKLVLFRDFFTPKLTLGKLYADGVKIGETCEDTDRQLELTPAGKVYGESAIPRGKYRMTLSFSPHFNKVMPEIHNVPGFEGVRIHGGNGPKDTLGCPLLGSVRTAGGVASCAVPNQRLHDLLEGAEDCDEETILEVK